MAPHRCYTPKTRKPVPDAFFGDTPWPVTGADLAPGRFDIVFTPGKGTTGYLIFSKITLGVGEKRTVFRDAAMSETE